MCQSKKHIKRQSVVERADNFLLSLSLKGLTPSLWLWNERKSGLIYINLTHTHIYSLRMWFSSLWLFFPYTHYLRTVVFHSLNHPCVWPINVSLHTVWLVFVVTYFSSSSKVIHSHMIGGHRHRHMDMPFILLEKRKEKWKLIRNIDKFYGAKLIVHKRRVCLSLLRAHPDFLPLMYYHSSQGGKQLFVFRKPHRLTHKCSNRQPGPDDDDADKNVMFCSCCRELNEKPEGFFFPTTFISAFV